MLLYLNLPEWSHLLLLNWLYFSFLCNTRGNATGIQEKDQTMSLPSRCLQYAEGILIAKSGAQDKTGGKSFMEACYTLRVQS